MKNLLILIIYIMVFFILIIVAVAAYCFLGNHDTAATKAALKAKQRNDDQKKVIRYFLNDGCLSKHISDQEYSQMVKSALAKFDFKQRALDKIGLDESELQEIDPVHFEGYQFKKAYGRLGKDKLWRSSKYQVSWLFFSATQVYLYQYTLNMDCDEKKENTEEYFYKDITNFSTSTETEEVFVYDKKKKKDVLENVDTSQFALVVPGDKLYCSMKQSDENERAIKGMKAKLREKKNA